MASRTSSKKTSKVVPKKQTAKVVPKKATSKKPARKATSKKPARKDKVVKKTQIRSNKKAPAQKKSQGKPFPLLNLPNELIRNVFLYSHNIHLVLANRRLHGLLSDNTTLLDFCILAFTPSAPAYDLWQYPPPPISPIVSHQTTILEAPWFDSSFALALQSRVPRLDAAAKHHAKTGLNGGLPDDPDSGYNPNTGRMLGGNYVKMPKRIMCLPWTEEKDMLFGILRSWDVELWPTQNDMDNLNEIIIEMEDQNKRHHARALQDFRDAWIFQFHPLH